jgi:DNA gyrase subunit A
MKNRFEDLEEVFLRYINEDLKNKDSVSINSIATKSFINYAGYVILSRSLPDLRDGLKPSQRRILFAMKNLGISHTGSHKKSARIVGDTIGKYHPHGDTAVYETMVNISQPWKTNLPLVDGQGNWGSIDGDSPAAMRYTEARMTKESSILFDNIDKKTVDFIKNYDGTETEPVVLPAPYPNILINGVLSGSIAVGMSTSILPHNPTEVMNTLDLILDNRIEKKETAPEEVLSIIKAPDFPTGGIIYNLNNMLDIIKTGKGRINLRGSYIEETIGKNRTAIIFTELPFTVNKAKLIDSIVNLKKDKKDSSIINMISTIRDESSAEGMRLVIELKSNADKEVVLNYLFKNTDLDIKLNYNSVVIDKVQKNNNISFAPKEYGLLSILNRYIDFRQEILINKWTFIKENTEKRLHILEGLIKALDLINKVIEIIKKSRKSETALNNLMEEFNFSKEQATAILNIRLSKLTGMEKRMLVDEKKELKAVLKEANKILIEKDYQLIILKSEFKEIKEIIKKERRTKIIEKIEVKEIKDSIQKEDFIIYITKKGYVKKINKKLFFNKKTAKEKLTIELNDNDYITHIFDTNNHKYLLFALTNGMIYSINIHDLPDSTRGTYIGYLFNINQNEEIINVFDISSFEEEVSLLFSIENGLVKRTSLKEFKGSTRKTGINGINLNGSKIIYSNLVKDNEEIILITKNSKSIKFLVSEISETGRSSKGVRGIKLKDGDKVIFSTILNNNILINLITENNFLKTIKNKFFKKQSRGGIGILIFKETKKTGPLKEILLLEKNLLNKVSKKNYLKKELNNFIKEESSIKELDQFLIEEEENELEEKLIESMKYINKEDI